MVRAGGFRIRLSPPLQFCGCCRLGRRCGGGAREGWSRELTHLSRQSRQVRVALKEATTSQTGTVPLPARALAHTGSAIAPILRASNEGTLAAEYVIAVADFAQSQQQSQGSIVLTGESARLLRMLLAQIKSIQELQRQAQLAAVDYSATTSRVSEVMQRVRDKLIAAVMMIPDIERRFGSSRSSGRATPLRLIRQICFTHFSHRLFI